MKALLTPTGAMRPWATVLAVMLGFGLALGFTIGYVKKVDQAAEKRNQQRAREFCTVIVLIDDRYQKLPPTADPEAMKFAVAIHTYRIKLGC